MNLMAAYEALLTMYPKSFQNDYADQMSQTLTDMVADESDTIKRTGIYMKAFAELPIHLVTANIEVLQHAYASTAPRYVTRNTQLSTALMMPLVLLVVFNELRPNIIPNSMSVIDILRFLTIGLPMIALTVLLITTFVWLFKNHNNRNTSNNLADVKHNWPLAVAGGFALVTLIFMVGHDSISCVDGNPFREAKNFRGTVQCLSQD